MIPPEERFWEDWSVGDTFESEPHLMTDERIRSFAAEFDPQPFHVDDAAAEASVYGGIIASGWHTGAVLMRLLTGFLGPTSMGSPGVDELRWRRPVRPGDRLRLRLTVLETRPSASKPDRGTVRWSQELFNQNDEIVMSLVAVLFIARRT